MYDLILKQLDELKIVPVVKLNDVKNAVPLAEALIKGGLPVAEVTFSTDAAVESIRAMSKIDGMFVGAGTVTSVEQAEQAVAAGVRYPSSCNEQ